MGMKSICFSLNSLERYMFFQKNLLDNKSASPVIRTVSDINNPAFNDWDLTHHFNSVQLQELKTLKLLHKIEKKMRRTKFEPEAAKSTLVFELAPITQCANYLFKFKSKDLELISKVLEKQLWREFFSVNSFSPRTAFMLTNVIKFFKKQLSKRFL